MTEWQVNSEYSSRKDMNTTVIQRSALIYLVLDCSTSLSTDNVTAIRAAAKQFIDLVYNPSSGGGQINSGISNISYYAYSGSTWTEQSDGRRKSPVMISNDASAICQVSFSSTGSNKQLVIALDVSSELDGDYAFVGKLDDSYASTYNYFERISGTKSKVITIPVPTSGYNHFVRIGYVKNGNSITSGLDSAWFKILN
jgi:hypothetical protein